MGISSISSSSGFRGRHEPRLAEPNGWSAAWPFLGGLLCGACVVTQSDQVTRLLAFSLAYGMAAMAISTNAVTLRRGAVQACGWLLPLALAVPLCGENYLSLSALTLVFVGVFLSIAWRNHKEFVGQLLTQQRLSQQEAELRLIFNNLGAGLNEADPISGRFLRVNPVFCRIVGRSEAELLDGMTVAQVSHPEDHARLRVNLIELIEGGRVFEGEKRYVRPDGTDVWVRVCASLTQQAQDGRAPRVLTLVHDITAHKAAEAALRESEEMLRLSMEAGRIGCFQCDLVTGLIYCGAETRAMLGWPPGDAPVSWNEWEAVILPGDRERLMQEMQAAHARKDIQQTYEYRFFHPIDGSVRYIEERVRVFYDSEARPVRSHGIAMDVTERRQAEARIAHLAHHDPLTDLPNRSLFHIRLDQALADARAGNGFALCYLDLDGFKEVNDTLGHPVGDALLLAVTKRLQAETRATDTVARLGGDEFAIIVAANGQPHSVEAVARRCLARLATPFEIDGHYIVVGASIGIASAPTDGLEAETLLNHADLALYRAKNQGGGCICQFEPEMDAQMVQRRALASDLRRALDVGEFVLFYQPIIKISTRKLVGFEALLRWKHPARGMIAPDSFIPLAEENGLIIPIGDWVLREACAQAMRWPEGLKVAVNLSVVSFRSATLVDNVAEALHISGLDPGRLELELTETVMLHDTAAALSTLRQLKALGVRLSLDDFGTGFSSLSYLQRFPFDKVKIDRSFISDFDQSLHGKAIVRAVIALCSALGLVTTAEGVETEAQWDTLTAEGCMEAQGYFISRPRPADALQGFLDASEWPRPLVSPQAA